MSTLKKTRNTKTQAVNLRIKLKGITCCCFVIILLLLSLPVFIYRVVVIFLAKILRPDFGDILNGQSALFVGDYFAATPPRSNLVLSMIFEGQLTLEQVHALVLKNWISNEELKKLQQFPVRWMGFTFWRSMPKPFLVNDYVHEYCADKLVEVTDQELDEIVEKLLNKRPLNQQSPWELHLIQNYRNAKNENEFTGMGKAKPHSVLILKWHHCLVDGMGAGALLEGLFQQSWDRKLETQPLKEPTLQKLLHCLTFPGKAFFALSSMLSYMFVDSSFKVPDSRKKWHQVYARSGLIPNQLVKDIKNAFGVSYTSVIISAISAAVHKTGMQNSASVHFMSVLPARGISKRAILSNHMAGATLDIPTTSYTNLVERLTRVHELFENSRRSVRPTVGQCFTSLMGNHLTLVNMLFLRNKRVAIGLTNFAGAPTQLQVSENSKWIHSRLAAGCLSGDGGIGISAFSHGPNMEVHIAAENALMTKKQAQEFVYNVRQEVETLGALVTARQIANKSIF